MFPPPLGDFGAFLTQPRCEDKRGDVVRTMQATLNILEEEEEEEQDKNVIQPTL